MLLVAARRRPSSSSTAFARGVARDEIATRRDLGARPAGRHPGRGRGRRGLRADPAGDRSARLGRRQHRRRDLRPAHRRHGGSRGGHPARRERRRPRSSRCATRCRSPRWPSSATSSPACRSTRSRSRDREIVTATTFTAVRHPDLGRDGPRAVRRRRRRARLHPDDDHRAGPGVLGRRPADRPGFGPLATVLLAAAAGLRRRRSSRRRSCSTGSSVEGDELVAQLSAHDAALGSFTTKGACALPLADEPGAASRPAFATMEPGFRDQAGFARLTTVSDVLREVFVTANPLAPGWLAHPDDANALAPTVWPRGATRAASGALQLGGIPAPALHAALRHPALRRRRGGCARSRRPGQGRLRRRVRAARRRAPGCTTRARRSCASRSRAG